jgi:hypothetical protein
MSLTKSVMMRASILMLLALSLVQCRAEHSGGLSEPLDAQADADWFDMDGLGAKCDTPPATCPGFDYEKEFVDSCVEKGGRSKTCGCAMRCSIKIEYTRLKPKAESVETKSAENLETTCNEEGRKQIKTIAERRRPGSDEDRCIEDFLCQGTTVRCQPESIPVVAKIRQLAKNGCTREAVGSLCLNGFSESLQCPDSNITQLTAILENFSDKANPARRCTRNILCFESENNCDSEQKSEALNYKKLLNKDGCEYWLRKLCALEN